jgi:hypothetical protein
MRKLRKKKNRFLLLGRLPSFRRWLEQTLRGNGERLPFRFPNSTWAHFVRCVDLRNFNPLLPQLSAASRPITTRKIFALEIKDVLRTIYSYVRKSLS